MDAANFVDDSDDGMDDIGDAWVDTFNTTVTYPLANPQMPEMSYENDIKATDQNDGPKLNPRSCVTCRKRKVRCDRREPCQNCTKAKIDCVFPPPGRAPRKPKRPQDAELLKRLRRLESVVDSLGAHETDEHDDALSPTKIKRTSDDLTAESEAPSRRTSLEYGLGRLLIKDGRSRYVSNDFWSTLGEEIAEIRNVLDDPSSGEDEDIQSPESASGTTENHHHHHHHHQGFIFGYSSLMFDMSPLQPSPSQIFILWSLFKENVDPVLKIFHAPTIQEIITRAAVRTKNLSKVHDAVFYSVCFAAATSATDDQCQSLLGDTKNKLMDRYRFATEQALSRVSFLNSSSLAVLQAFVMFLQVVRYTDTSKAIWSLSALAMAQAQAQGLHRDGTNFSLSPFEIEMRRRLWWQISLLDARASEDHGADPQFNDRFFDTKMPLNVNDDEISPGMTEPPKERDGASDMTFSLVRFELGNISRRLRLLANASTPEDRMRTVQDREHLVEMTNQKMEEKYFSKCDPNVAYLWVASTVGRLILAKMWLMIHHPRINHEDSNAGGELKARIFMTSVEVIEFGHLLSSHKSTAKWSWLFRTYMQWHAVAYVLSELCIRPLSADTERAWQAVDSKRMSEHLETQRSMLWRPLKQLYAKAKAHRAQLLREQIAESPASVGNTSTSSGGIAAAAADSTPSDLSNKSGIGNGNMDVVTATGDIFGLDFSNLDYNTEVQGLDGTIYNGALVDYAQPTTGEVVSGKGPFGGVTDAFGMNGFDFASALGTQDWDTVMQQGWGNYLEL